MLGSGIGCVCAPLGVSRTMSRLSSLGRTAASAGGLLLQAAVTALALVRPAAKPMHPIGRVLTGRLERVGVPGQVTGSAFLDGAGEDQALVRLSRSVGLRSPRHDVNGLALRVPAAGGGDLLLSTTGWGRLTRYALVPHRSPRAGNFTCLVPYRTPTGPVHIGARASGADRFELFWARPTGGWHRFAELVLQGGPGTDQDVSFDAILHMFEGLENYEWYRRLRAPSYAAARRLRGAVAPSTEPAQLRARRPRVAFTRTARRYR